MIFDCRFYIGGVTKVAELKGMKIGNQVGSSTGNTELEAAGRKAQIDFKHIPADEVHKGISVILQQSPEVQQEMVKYIKFEG